MDLTISKKSLYFNDEEFTLIKGDSFWFSKLIGVGFSFKL